MQFCWNLQLLTRCFLCRNLPFCTSDLFTVKGDRISVALNTSSITRPRALDILTWDSIEHANCFLHKIKFQCVYVRMFFLIESFLVEENYELSKSRSHILSVSLTLLYIGILSWSLSLVFCIKFLLGDVLCKFAI